MSLDVHLYRPNDGGIPGACYGNPVEVWSWNCTHNLTSMADAAGLYEALWRPDEHGLTHAHQLLPLLEEGLRKLKNDPTGFRDLNPDNGWGSYEGLIHFVASYIDACIHFPEASIEVSR